MHYGYPRFTPKLHLSMTSWATDLGDPNLCGSWLSEPERRRAPAHQSALLCGSAVILLFCGSVEVAVNIIELPVDSILLSMFESYQVLMLVSSAFASTSAIFAAFSFASRSLMIS